MLIKVLQKIYDPFDPKYLLCVCMNVIILNTVDFQSPNIDKSDNLHNNLRGMQLNKKTKIQSENGLQIVQKSCVSNT